MEIIIYDDIQRRQTLIYGRRDLNGKEEIIGFDSEKGCLEISTIDYWEVIIGNVKPLLIIPLGMKTELLGALTIALNNQNIKTKDQHLIEGELNATKKHLEDLQQITKHVLKIKS